MYSMKVIHWLSILFVLFVITDQVMKMLRNITVGAWPFIKYLSNEH